nr:transposase [Mesorhizobium sp.]
MQASKNSTIRSEQTRARSRRWPAGRIAGVRYSTHGKRQPPPVAKEALDWIAQLYAVEAEARGKPMHDCLAIRVAAKPQLAGLFAWMEVTAHKLSARSALAEAFHDTRVGAAA